MAKTFSPLFGTSASGSLGGKITFRSRGSESIVTSIPTHPDAQTAPQLAHRAEFRACATRWHTLTFEEKSHCRVCADQLGITPYNYFIRECLAGRY